MCLLRVPTQTIVHNSKKMNLGFVLFLLYRLLFRMQRNLLSLQLVVRDLQLHQTSLLLRRCGFCEDAFEDGRVVRTFGHSVDTCVDERGRRQCVLRVFHDSLATLCIDCTAERHCSYHRST